MKLSKIAEEIKKVAKDPIAKTDLVEGLKVAQKEMGLELSLINLNSHLKNFSFDDLLQSNKMQLIDVMEYKSEDCGVLAPIIKTGKIEFLIGVNQDERFIIYRLNYSYQHLRGNNGYNIRALYFVDTKKVVIQNV
jgi:hypothetical protein